MCQIVADGSLSVAPHAGAWIETETGIAICTDRPVAPHAGAWIETGHAIRISRAAPSRPPRGGVD